MVANIIQPVYRLVVRDTGFDDRFHATLRESVWAVTQCIYLHAINGFTPGSYSAVTMCINEAHPRPWAVDLPQPWKSPWTAKCI